MDLRDRPEDEAFRKEVRTWLADHVVGEFAALGGRGGSGDETFGFDVRLEWEKVLAAGGWTCLGWPVEFGGRGAVHRPAGHLQRGVRQGEGTRTGEHPGRGAARAHPDPVRDESAAGPLPAARSWTAPNCGARATPSRTPGVTWPTWRPGPSSTGTTGSSPARRCGHRSPTSPTGASWCVAPSRVPPAQGPVLPPRAHGPARGGDPADHPVDPDVGVQRGVLRRGPHRRATWWWASRGTAGGWRSPPWPTSAVWDCSATSSRSGVSSTT